MKYLLTGFLLLGACKEKEIETVSHDGTKQIVMSSEDFEGRYYFDNGGIVELYNDYNNQISSQSSTLTFPNSNNTLASFSFPNLSRLDLVNGQVKSVLTSMTGAQASNFIGNIDGNSQNGVQLNSGATFRYQLVLEFKSDRLNVSIEIQQLSGVLYSTVYKNTVISR